MRIRQSLIIEDSILKRIDEIAGEKNRRAATIERALTEFIEREDKKAKSSPPAPAPVTAKSKAIASAAKRISR